jgi:hypothetical protein
MKGSIDDGIDDGKLWKLARQQVLCQAEIAREMKSMMNKKKCERNNERKKQETRKTTTHRRCCHCSSNVTKHRHQFQERIGQH